MADRSDRQLTSRAEARRRARLAARGEELEPEDFEDEPEPPPRQTFLSRLIPPAPPLPGKDDPLAGFTYEGRLRPVVAGLYLLSRNPLAWVIPALIWIAAQEIVRLPGFANETVALIGSIGQYAALIAAGWVGWQRPWLFGAVAGALAVLGWIVFDFVLLALHVVQFPIGGIGDIVQSVLAEMIIYGAIGAVAGWYGGYLRRRLSDQRSRQPATPNRRR